MRFLKVSHRGIIKPSNQNNQLLTKLLAGEPVGMLESGEDAYQIFYGNVMLATVSLRENKMRIVRVARRRFSCSRT